MADNVTADPGAGGAVFRADEDSGTPGLYWPYAKLAWGADNTQTIVAAGAAAVPIQDGGNSITVDGTVTATGPLTDAQLRASPVPISGTVTIQDGGNVIDVQGTVTATGPLTDVQLRASAVPVDASGAAVPVTDNGGSLTVDGSVSLAAAIPAGNNNIGDVDVVSLPALPAGNNNIGDVDIASAIPAGNNNIGDVDVASIAAGTTLIGDVDLQPRTTGGLSLFKSIDLDESEEEVKGSAGKVYGYYFANLHATNTLYLKWYNNTAAGTTVGTTVPDFTMPVPAGSIGHESIPQGWGFGTGITVAVTTGLADNNSGAPGANEFVLNVWYK